MGKEKTYPPSAALIRIIICYFIDKEGKTHRGFFVKNPNKYICGVYRWRDVDTGKWYDDDEVLMWKDIPNYIF